MTCLEGHFPLGQDGVKSLLCPFAFVCFDTGLEAEAVVPGFQDMELTRFRGHFSFPVYALFSASFLD